VVEDGGHTWPGSLDVPLLGETTREIDATDLIWEFFAAHGDIR
jgi:polyhydroxybutyrate depolymerase